MAKFVNRKNALERSNSAHARLHRIMYERKDIVSSEYHFDVLVKQHQRNKILSRKERNKIYIKKMKKYGVYGGE